MKMDLELKDKWFTDKRQLLFILKDYLQLISIEDIQFIYKNILSYKEYTDIYKFQLKTNAIIELDKDYIEIRWYNACYQLHRDNGPAVVYDSGKKKNIGQMENGITSNETLNF